MKATEEIIADLKAKEADLVLKVEELKNAQSELNMIQGALKALGAVNGTHVHLFAPASYNPNATWKEKIKYVVILKGGAGIKDISDKIFELEPNMDPKTIYNSVAVNVGEMVNKTKVLSAKEGDGKKIYYYVGK